MLLRFFKYNTTAGYLLIPLLTIIAWWPSLASDSYRKMAFDYIPMPLYEMLTGYLPHHSLTSKIMAMALVMITGFYLTRINNKYLFLQERTLLPAFFFILLASSLPPLHRLNPALISMVFLIPAIEKLLASYKTEGLSYNFFEASFLLGLGSLFYFNLVYFIFLVWVALFILRPVIWREWVFSLMGLATPWFFFLAVSYFIHDSADYSMEVIAANFTTRDVFSFMLLPEKIFFGFMLLMIIFASRKIAGSMHKMKVLSRKIFILFFWIYAISVIIYFVVETANIEMAIPATLPVAFLLSHYILAIRKRFWSNVILWCIVIGLHLLVWQPWKLLPTG